MTVIPYCKHEIKDADRLAVIEALDSGWIAGSGPTTKRFEEKVQEITGYKYAVTVNSGTAALHVAIQAVYGELPHRTTIAVPALSFVATANAVLHAGRKVEFYDIDPTNMTGDKWGDVGVSYAGYPVRYCTVADDAHALRPDMPKGPIARCVSTHALKQVTTAEGGLVLTDDGSVAEMCRILRDHGRTTVDSMKYLGYNYRMPDICAALGLSQIQRLGKNLHRRKEIVHRYLAGLDDLQSYIQLPPSHPAHAWHLFVIRLNLDKIKRTRDEFKTALFSHGIGTQLHYKPITEMGYYQDYKRIDHIPWGELLPNTYSAWQRILSLPLYPSMTDEEVERVLLALHKVVESVVA